MTFRRSEYFAVAYAANDIVLIWLWIFASQEDLSYLSVVACFAAFLINDIYGYISWLQKYLREYVRMDRMGYGGAQLIAHPII